jgi:hypothetical protein
MTSGRGGAGTLMTAIGQAPGQAALKPEQLPLLFFRLRPGKPLRAEPAF